MSETQTITIEVDGQKLTANPGQMLIDVTDAAGITVPRFCYHKKLSVSANCRMCLVEVERAPKPMPACATPVADGMKVFTRSPAARAAQKGTMEFLLINHPLDCPICDQGGECELQDVAMGYGEGISRFSEGKRVVANKDIGPLVSTDMTRCIHCTRCVRFGAEIAGVREMGATGRGEHMTIGVYVEKTVDSELSGNIIDLCPVGALTSKPFRYTARAWELNQTDSVAGHDAVGSNLHVHVRRNKVMRVVPKENEAVNEVWISDRDRFSYQGLYAEDRLTKPLVRDNSGNLREADWQEALQQAAVRLKEAGEGLGALVSPNATVEEMFLAQKLVRGLGSDSIDYRLRQSDFRNPEADPAMPWLGQPLAAFESNQATLLIGSWLRKELPLLNHRVRKSTLAGGRVMAINALDYDFNYELASEIVAKPGDMAAALAGVAKALGADTAGIQANESDAAKAIAEALKQAGQGSVLLGGDAQMHPDFTLLRQLAANIAEAAGVTLGYVGLGANDAGAWMAGAVPKNGGRNAAAMCAEPMAGYLLVGIEPEFDSADPAAMAKALANAKVVALSAYRSPWLDAHADVLLPIGGFAESSGSYLNGQGDLQGFGGAVSPLGEARPAWKVLRVLGNLADIDGFDYDSSEAVRDEAVAAAGDITPDNALKGKANGSPSLDVGDALQRIGGVPMYSVDALVRRAPALQRTADAWKPGMRVHPQLAEEKGLVEGDSTVLKQGDGSVTLPVYLDPRVPVGCIWLPTAVPGSELLGAGFGSVSLEKA